MLADAFFGGFMNKIKSAISYFSKFELGLWSVCVILITVSFCIFDRENYSTLIASLIGVTALIFCAKGNPIGQLLMVVFSIIKCCFSFFGKKIL